MFYGGFVVLWLMSTAGPTCAERSLRVLLVTRSICCFKLEPSLLPEVRGLWSAGRKEAPPRTAGTHCAPHALPLPPHVAQSAAR